MTAPMNPSPDVHRPPTNSEVLGCMFLALCVLVAFLGILFFLYVVNR